ncbi:MAG: T9SS type A sorting domain-containing protein [Bacteroidota bacterium]|jgi:hypothetical protein
MKKIKVLKLAFLFITLIMSNRLEAQTLPSVAFTYPTSSATIYCTTGQTKMDVAFKWTCNIVPDGTMGKSQSGYTGDYYFFIIVDGSQKIFPKNYNPCPYDVVNMTLGGHNATIYLVQYYFNSDDGSTTEDSTYDVVFFTISTKFTITASAGTGGTITPSGSVVVVLGGSQTFKINANPGYRIADVNVNTNSVGAVSSFTFNNVISNQTISATFAINTYTISGSVGVSGVVMNGLGVSTDASGNYAGKVNYGWSGTVTPTKTGYSFNPTSRTYTNVTSDQGGGNYIASLYITVNNSFNSGIVNVDGSNYPSGSTFSWTLGSAHTLLASDNISYMDANDYTYTLHFVNWTTPSGIVSGNPISITPTIPGTYTANIEGVGISGPSSLSKGNRATYTANVPGGSGSFTYQWYELNGPPGSSWVSGGTSQTETIGMLLWNISVRVDVHDNTTGFNGTAYFTINYNSGSNAKYASPSFPGQAITMQADNPTTFALSNYPNPFNPTTTITYQLPEAGYVTLKVYDVMGREVALLQDGMKGVGFYTATFDASRLASGIYFSRLIVQPQEGKPIVQTNKLMLMK